MGAKMVPQLLLLRAPLKIIIKALCLTRKTLTNISLAILSMPSLETNSIDIL